MRDIKFRLWNPEANVITGGTELNTILITTNSEFVKEFNRCKMVWMQFTGLQDNTLKDIYEGDIVNFAVKRKTCPDCAKDEYESELKYGISKFCPNCGKSLTNTDFITTSKVVFDKGGFAYEWINEESYYQQWQTHVAQVYIEWVEIIGNVYEHPELLTNK